MKRLITLCLAALLLPPLLPAVSAAEEPTPPPETGSPTLSCASALLMEKETGAVLLEQDPHRILEPASLTKIMTLLLVMEALDSQSLTLDEPVTVSAYAAGMGGSQVYLKEGEQFPVDQLLKCVTVVSGNDCAVALAEHLAGSEAAFAARMNLRARELGMEHTNFVNCTGLPAPGHQTCAYDVALMSRELILHHPDIRQYTTIWTDSIRDGAFGLTNTNRLIRFYPGATGLKTGSTASAGFCVSATAQREEMELIAVVMNAPTSAQRWADAKALLDYGFASYALAQVYPDPPAAPIPVRLGVTPQVQPVPARECRLLVRREEAGQITTRLTLPEELTAPIAQGQTLGQLEIYVDDELRDTVPMLAAQPVEKKTVPALFLTLLRQLVAA